MRTTLAIDDQLLDKAKSRARERGETLGQYVEEALRREMTSDTTAHDDVELTVAPGGRLRPGIDPSSTRDLYDVLDEDDASLRTGRGA